MDALLSLSWLYLMLQVGLLAGSVDYRIEKHMYSKGSFAGDVVWAVQYTLRADPKEKTCLACQMQKIFGSTFL